METYDKKKIGKCISWGSDHTVYEYGADEVIKFSVSDFLLGNREKSVRDHEVAVLFFGQYILKTDFLFSPSLLYFAAVQPKVAGHYLSAADLAIPSVQNQFREIMQAYTQMKKTYGSEIDLVGSGGILRNRLSNIFVTAENKLVIIDTSILEVRGHSFHPLKYLFLLIICPIALGRQHAIITKFNSLL